MWTQQPYEPAGIKEFERDSQAMLQDYPWLTAYFVDIIQRNSLTHGSPELTPYDAPVYAGMVISWIRSSVESKRSTKPKAAFSWTPLSLSTSAFRNSYRHYTEV